MKKTILQYGLISGAVAAILMLVMAFYMRSNPGDMSMAEVLGYTGIVLSMVFVFLGVRAYREQLGRGSFSFGKAFQAGLFIALISCAIYVATWLIISRTLMPDFMDQFIDYTLQKMRDSGASAEEISRQTAEMEKYKKMYENPLISAAITFLEPFPIGLLVALLSAGILRRR